nr:hypothetical protein [Paenibacillus sp.]
MSSLPPLHAASETWLRRPSSAETAVRRSKSKNAGSFEGTLSMPELDWMNSCHTRIPFRSHSS